jgi:hypothetical protein
MSQEYGEEPESLSYAEELDAKKETVPTAKRTFVVPDSRTKLLACERCRIIKT